MDLEDYNQLRHKDVRPIAPNRAKSDQHVHNGKGDKCYQQVSGAKTEAISKERRKSKKKKSNRSSASTTNKKKKRNTKFTTKEEASDYYNHRNPVSAFTAKDGSESSSTEATASISSLSAMETQLVKLDNVTKMDAIKRSGRKISLSGFFAKEERQRYPENESDDNDTFSITPSLSSYLLSNPLLSSPFGNLRRRLSSSNQSIESVPTNMFVGIDDLCPTEGFHCKTKRCNDDGSKNKDDISSLLRPDFLPPPENELPPRPKRSMSLHVLGSKRPSVQIPKRAKSIVGPPPKPPSTQPKAPKVTQRKKISLTIPKIEAGRRKKSYLKGRHQIEIETKEKKQRKSFLKNPSSTRPLYYLVTSVLSQRSFVTKLTVKHN